MAINEAMIGRRLADRKLFLIAAALFPLLVLVGYSRTFYFRAFFDVPALATSLVYVHGTIMSLWVAYFSVQVFLIRSKNIKLHMTTGMIGIGLAAVMVVVGMATAWDAHIVRRTAPPGLDPHAFFLIPVLDMAIFVLFFAGAIYYRKRPTEHKSLMLLTAINFVPAAVGRIPGIPPEHMIEFAFGAPILFGLASLGWHTWKHRRLNATFALATALLVASVPFRLIFANSKIWLEFTNWLAS